MKGLREFQPLGCRRDILKDNAKHREAANKKQWEEKGREGEVRTLKLACLSFPQGESEIGQSFVKRIF